MRTKTCAETANGSGLPGRINRYAIRKANSEEVLCVGNDISELVRAQRVIIEQQARR